MFHVELGRTTAGRTHHAPRSNGVQDVPWHARAMRTSEARRTGTGNLARCGCGAPPPRVGSTWNDDADSMRWSLHDTDTRPRAVDERSNPLQAATNTSAGKRRTHRHAPRACGRRREARSLPQHILSDERSSDRRTHQGATPRATPGARTSTGPHHLAARACITDTTHGRPRPVLMLATVHPRAALQRDTRPRTGQRSETPQQQRQQIHPARCGASRLRTEGSPKRRASLTLGFLD